MNAPDHLQKKAMNIRRIKAQRPVHVGGVSIQPSMGLQEYRERYPRMATTPTLTQGGMIGFLLERRQERSARREKRRAARQRLMEAVIRPMEEVWRALSGAYALK